MGQKVRLIAKLVGLFFVMPLWSFFASLVTMDSDVAVGIGFLGFGVLIMFVGLCVKDFVMWLVTQIEKETT
jgi:hypothetical protein